MKRNYSVSIFSLWENRDHTEILAFGSNQASYSPLVVLVTVDLTRSTRQLMMQIEDLRLHPSPPSETPPATPPATRQPMMR